MLIMAAKAGLIIVSELVCHANYLILPVDVKAKLRLFHLVWSSEAHGAIGLFT